MTRCTNVGDKVPVHSEGVVSVKIYILLPVHNRRPVTQAFVDCLKVQTFRNYHLLLIDDGSTDGTSEMVQEQIKHVSVIRGSGNWWWAGCLHQGYLWLKAQKTADDDLVLIMNDDTEYDQDFLETGRSLMCGQKNTLLLATAFSKTEPTKKVLSEVHVDWGKLTFLPAESPEKINCLSTRGLFLHMSDFTRTGGFHPRILPHYISDYEFTIRAFNKGMRLRTDSRLHLLVDERTTGLRSISFESFRSFLKSVYSVRSIFNPFHWTVFIVLCCPWRWQPVNLYRIWKNAILCTGKACFLSLKGGVAKLFRFDPS